METRLKKNHDQLVGDFTFWQFCSAISIYPKNSCNLNASAILKYAGKAGDVCNGGALYKQCSVCSWLNCEQYLNFAKLLHACFLALIMQV